MNLLPDGTSSRLLFIAGIPHRDHIVCIHLVHWDGQLVSCLQQQPLKQVVLCTSEFAVMLYSTTQLKAIPSMLTHGCIHIGMSSIPVSGCVSIGSADSHTSQYVHACSAEHAEGNTECELSREVRPLSASQAAVP